MNVASWQRRIKVLMWISYASLYLGRVNLAMILPAMERDLGWSTAQLGLVGGVFFWVYAFGQLINGHLGDRFSSKGIVLIGLVGTALMNLFAGFVSSFFLMVILWAINGCFQSMGWGPIVKMTSNWFSENERGQMTGILGTSSVGGFMLSWFLASRIIARYPDQWRLVLWIPSVLLMVMAILWAILAKDRPEDLGFAPINPVSKVEPPKESIGVILKENFAFFGNFTLLLLAVASSLQGMVKEGINLWAPTLLMQAHHLPAADATSYALWIPPLGFFGVLLAGKLSQRAGGNESRTIVGMYIVVGIVSLVGAWLIKLPYFALTVLTVAICSGLIYGINALLMVSIPLRFQSVGKESTVAGFMDFASYVGSGLTGVVTGALLQYWDWSRILVLWGIVCGLGAVIVNMSKLESLAARRESGAAELAEQ